MTVTDPVTSGVVEIPLSGPPLENDVSPSLSTSPPFALPQFIAGPENHLVEVAVAAVLEESAGTYNPVVIHGPSGSGKTHLSSGLFRAWKKLHPRRPATLIAASDFAREYREAVETKTEEQFHAPYLRTRLLVLENLDELGGREAIQAALAVLLDRMLAEGAWVVVTSRAPPARLSGLSEALRARLTAGLKLRLALPSLQTRLEILERVTRLRDTDVDTYVLEALAEGLAVPVPELVGALVQLEAEAQLQASPISLASAQRLLADRRDTRRPTLSQIAKATAKHFGVSVADLRGPSRRRAFVSARNVAVYLARNLTESSLEQVGAYFGNRDHTTISHGYRRIEASLQSEPVIRDAVAELQAKLLLRG